MDTVREIQDFFARYQNLIEKGFSDWSRLYQGFRESGYLSGSSLRELGKIDGLSHDVKLENDLPFALTLSYSRTVRDNEQLSVGRQLQDMCLYLFREARYRFYLENRIDMPFYRIVVEDGAPLSLTPFWHVYRALSPSVPGPEVENRCNAFLERAMTLPGGRSLRLFAPKESCSLVWLRQTASPLPDEIFLGYALIREFFFEALPAALHEQFNAQLERCVNRFFIAHGLGY